MLTKTEENFINESNMIEGINRPYTQAEAEAFTKFMELEYITIEDLQDFVEVYQANAKLRSKQGMNVTVGNHYPMEGGPGVAYELAGILGELEDNTPYQNHVMYELLHPFTDCNGRSGRILWLWQMRNGFMKNPTLGFLHTFYYQTLAGATDV